MSENGSTHSTNSFPELRTNMFSETHSVPQHRIRVNNQTNHSKSLVNDIPSMHLEQRELEPGSTTQCTNNISNEQRYRPRFLNSRDGSIKYRTNNPIPHGPIGLTNGEYLDEPLRPGTIQGIEYTEDGELLIFREIKCQYKAPRVEQSNPIHESNHASKSVWHNRQLTQNRDEYDSDDRYDPYSRVSTPDIYGIYEEWD